MAWSIGAPLLLLAGAESCLRGAVPACGTTPFRTSELDGLSAEFRPGFRTLYKGHQVSFNSDGYRGPEFPERRTGVLRVALVGDSFTFGTAVALEDTLAVRLQSALAERGREAQVLNLGVPGYTASNVAAVVESRALALQPDVVLYVFYANDVEPPREWGEIPPDSIIDALDGYPLHSAFLQWTLVRTKQVFLAFGVQLARRTPQASRAEYAGAGGARVRASLVRMQEACEQEGVRLLIAAYPHLTRSAHNPFRPIDEGLAADCAALDLEYVDLLEAFGAEGNLARYWASVFDHHPDGEANALVASLLATRL